jgi:Cu-Zn family superoxide dismutase
MNRTQSLAGAAFVLAALASGCTGGGQPSASSPEAGKAAEGARPASAEAILEARSDSRVTGRAVFTSENGAVSLRIEAQGLTPGAHAIHLHEVGDCSAPDATSAGPHWNPTGHDHGQWGQDPFHLGDIGNLVAGEDGKASLAFSTDRWTIGGPAETNIVGRSVIVHVSADDFTTQPTGNAGGRVACGVVREVE